jgi:hypothetical protein
MKKKAIGKLAFKKVTIHTLSKVNLVQKLKGGTMLDTTANLETEANCPSLQLCTELQCTLHASNCNSVCGCGPTASALNRCATGGLCIPTYSCYLGCGGN